MKMKTTMLTFLLVLSITAAFKWPFSLVSADTTTSVCGVIGNYRPATATTSGLLTIGQKSYTITPGTVIGGQSIVAIGLNMCFNLTLDSSEQIVSPSTIGGSTISVCGAINSFRAPGANTTGSISIGPSNYTIAADTVINGQNLINVGSDMCLTAFLNTSGLITSPNVISVNQPVPCSVCGTVSGYKSPTATDAGLLGIGGMNFTVAPGAFFGFIGVGSNQCLEGNVDAEGRLTTPSSILGNTGGAAKICGLVSAFNPAGPGEFGSITISGIKLPIAQGVTLIGQDNVKVGSNICLVPIFSNGFISAGSVSASDPSCFQFSSPLITHGLSDGEDDTFLLDQLLTFSIVTPNSGAIILPINQQNFGLDPEYGRRASGIMAIRENTTVRALSCLDSFWDGFFHIASKGQSEGDMVTIFIQNPNGSGSQTLAMFTMQNGGLVLNQVHPDLIFLVNSNGPVGAGTFIPLISPAGQAGARTPLLTIIFSMTPNSTLHGCYQMGIEIKRAGGSGMTSFIPDAMVVKRMGDEAQGPSLTGRTGTYPRGLICGVVCSGCFPQPTPSPTPTPSPSPSPSPSPTVSPTPTPTPPPMPTKCDTICFRTSDYYLVRLESLPNGSVIIGGTNQNAPVNIQRSLEKVRAALQGGASSLAQLNEQFVATQISLLKSGGSGSPSAFAALWSPLRCSGLSFSPVTLSNGVTLSPESLLNDLITEATNAIKMNRTADYIPIAQILALLNNQC